MKRMFFLSRRTIKGFTFLCLFFFGIITIIASGGGDDDDDDDIPPPPANVSYINFLNDITCGDYGTTAVLTVCGVNLYSQTNVWSGCAIEYPQTCDVSYYLSSDCGVLSYEGAVNLYADCSYAFTVDLDADGYPYVYYTETCPGDCGTSTILSEGKQETKHILHKFPVNGAAAGFKEKTP